MRALEAGALVQEETVDSDAVRQQCRQFLHTKAQKLQTALRHSLNWEGSLDPTGNG